MKSWSSVSESWRHCRRHWLLLSTSVGYMPLVSMSTVHHMNMVACENPASSEPFWSAMCLLPHPYPCYTLGQMGFIVAKVHGCFSMVGIGMLFPSIFLRVCLSIEVPDWLIDIVNLLLDRGIVVGKGTPYKYVVLNIHYLPMVQNDNSGNQIIFARTRLIDMIPAMTLWFSGAVDRNILPVSCQVEQRPFNYRPSPSVRNVSYLLIDKR